MSPAVAIATAYTCAMHKRVPPRRRVARGCAVVSCVLCVRGTVCVVLFARYCGKVCTVVPSRAPFRMAEWKFSGMRNSEWRMEVVLAFAPTQERTHAIRYFFFGPFRMFWRSHPRRGLVHFKPISQVYIRDIQELVVHLSSQIT